MPPDPPTKYVPRCYFVSGYGPVFIELSYKTSLAMILVVTKTIGQLCRLVCRIHRKQPSMACPIWGDAETKACPLGKNTRPRLVRPGKIQAPFGILQGPSLESRIVNPRKLTKNLPLGSTLNLYGYWFWLYARN